MTMTRQQMYGREFKILEGDSLTGLCEGAIAAGGGVLATNTAMMCRPFCASGAGNPIISAHRSPFPGIEWNEVWFGYQGFTSDTAPSAARTITRCSPPSGWSFNRVSRISCRIRSAAI